MGLEPHQLFIPDKESKEFDRHKVLSKLYKELKGKIEKDLEDTIRKYSKT
ncbi:unnamed protein product [marine sediment metagenome]|uniref:Uncharacterized protein n=1 Tax=marine sediment metagenome TaxID=412755 RepID=X0RV57_9ZZZZ